MMINILIINQLLFFIFYCLYLSLFIFIILSFHYPIEKSKKWKCNARAREHQKSKSAIYGPRRVPSPAKRVSRQRVSNSKWPPTGPQLSGTHFLVWKSTKATERENDRNINTVKCRHLWSRPFITWTSQRATTLQGWWHLILFSRFRPKNPSLLASKKRGATDTKLPPFLLGSRRTTRSASPDRAGRSGKLCLVSAPGQIRPVTWGRPKWMTSVNKTFFFLSRPPSTKKKNFTFDLNFVCVCVCASRPPSGRP